MPLPSNLRFNWNSTSSVDLADVFARKELFFDAGLYAWGRGGVYGDMGNNQASSNYSSPVQIGSLTNWKQVSSGATDSAAIKTDGTLWTWGRNNQGQLGNGTVTSYSSPIQVGSLTNWNQISIDNDGNFFVALKTDGTLWSCGYGFQGQLGNGATSKYSSPIQIGALTNWRKINTGVSSAFAITSNGSLYSWGLNDQGQLGNNTTDNYSSPIQIGTLTDWKAISVGATVKNVLAIKANGTLWGWGRNSLGNLGNGTTTDYSSPIQIGSLTDWLQVSAGSSLGGAIKNNGTLWTWGYNNRGQLGNGTFTSYSSPIQIGSLTNWKQINCGNGFCAAIKRDGTLWSWGDILFLGIGTPTSYYSSPVQIGSLTYWKTVGGKDDVVLAIASPDLP